MLTAGYRVYFHIILHCHELSPYKRAPIQRKLRDQHIADCNGKPPLLKKAVVLTVPAIEHHLVVIAGITPD
jgi:hypothetical protein